MDLKAIPGGRLFFFRYIRTQMRTSAPAHPRPLFRTSTPPRILHRQQKTPSHVLKISLYIIVNNI